MSCHSLLLSAIAAAGVAKVMCATALDAALSWGDSNACSKVMAKAAAMDEERDDGDGGVAQSLLGTSKESWLLRQNVEQHTPQIEQIGRLALSRFGRMESRVASALLSRHHHPSFSSSSSTGPCFRPP